MTKQRGYNLIDTKIGYLQRNKGQSIFRNIRNTGFQKTIEKGLQRYEGKTISNPEFYTQPLRSIVPGTH